MKLYRLCATVAVVTALALPLFSGKPACAQTSNDPFQTDLQKAMDTLNRLQQLLDQIANRQSSQSSDQGNMNNSGNTDNSDSGNSDSN